MSNLTKNTNDLQEVLKILANKVDSSTLQPKHDEGLNTGSKEVVGAINELRNEIYCPERITDLTNTTWSIQAGWEAEAGYGKFNIDVSVTNDSYLGTVSLSSFYIGYNSLTNQYNDSIYLGYDPGYDADLIMYPNYSAFSVTFTGGTDATNPELIAWVSKYGEQQGAPTNLVNRIDQAENAINEISDKTIDKIDMIALTTYDAQSISTTNGLAWRDTSAFTVGEDDYDSIPTMHRVPITAGKNVTFEVDEEHQVVKINHAPYSQGLAYVLSSDGTYYFVTGIGTCTDNDVVIPSTHNSLPVTRIGDSAFSGRESLTSMIIPDSVTDIGVGAFANCSSLRSVEIPDSVTSVNIDVFENCTSLTIYCEAESQPDTWTGDWNPNDRPVVWGFANNFVAVNDKLGDVSTVLNTLITKSQNILEGGTE